MRHTSLLWKLPVSDGYERLTNLRRLRCWWRELFCEVFGCCRGRDGDGEGGTNSFVGGVACIPNKRATLLGTLFPMFFVLFVVLIFLLFFILTRYLFKWGRVTLRKGWNIARSWSYTSTKQQSSLYVNSILHKEAAAGKGAYFRIGKE